MGRKGRVDDAQTTKGTRQKGKGATGVLELRGHTGFKKRGARAERQRDTLAQSESTYIHTVYSVHTTLAYIYRDTRAEEHTGRGAAHRQRVRWVEGYRGEGHTMKGEKSTRVKV
jgi:hypothetical protein